MKKFFLLIIILSAISSFGQMNNKLQKKEKLLSADSVVEKIQELKDSVVKSIYTIDSAAIKANENNINALLKVQKDREAKQKRNAIIRIAIGIGFLLILIIGWRRKAKKERG